MKTIHYLLLAAGLCVLTSACDDESSEGARLTFEPALESLEFTTEGGSQTFLLYSNVPEWSIRCRYGDEWIDVWPAEGDFDGRFSVTVDENDRAELRTLEVRQQAPAPAIATNFTEKQVAASAASFDVLVTCNAEWRAEVSPEDEAWLSLGERTATRLNVVCAVNDTGASREGAVRLYIPGTACEVSLAVKQSNN